MIRRYVNIAPEVLSGQMKSADRFLLTTIIKNVHNRNEKILHCRVYKRYHVTALH